MKNRVQAIIVALTVLTFSGMCFAQAKSETSTPPAKTATKAKTSRIRGEVTSVDAKAGTLDGTGCGATNFGSDGHCSDCGADA